MALSSSVSLLHLLKQVEMVFLKRQHTLVPELSKCGRHGAAVHRQIVCQLLAVQRDIKLRPSGPACLGGQITEQLVPGGAAAMWPIFRVRVRFRPARMVSRFRVNSAAPGRAQDSACTLLRNSTSASAAASTATSSGSPPRQA